MLGTQLLNYRITAKLGEGGMGEVFLAEDISLGRKVALKILSRSAATDPESKHRFLHEAKAQAMLSHANIATFYELAEVQGHTLIAMEYVDGQPLSEAVRERELHPTEALDLVIQVAAGLQAAHEKGVTHRDVKPANIMVTPRGEVKITDFGLARWKGASTLTRKGTRLGTAYYMSPEQAEGKRVDHRADIFSTGVILYELLCRHRPFEGDSEAVVLYEILHSHPQPLARYCNCAPDQLEDIVRKCLERNPEDRYQSAADLITDLRHVKHQIETGQIDVNHDRANYRARRVARTVLAVVAFLVVAGSLTAIPAARYQVLKMLGLDPLPPARHLAVLPFQDLGQSTDRSVLAIGLAETVASKVTQMEQFQSPLRVIPAREVRDIGVDNVREARRAFGATLAVTGSMQDVGSNTRVILNLVDAVSERQLRSSVLDIPTAAMPDLQDSICVVLARMLEIELLPEQHRYLTGSNTRNSAAYEYYLRGAGHLQSYTSKVGTNTIIDVFQLDSAIESFQQALDKDPDYALAHAGLAEAYWRKSVGLDEPHWQERAILQGQQAIALSNELVEGYVTLATIYRGTGQYDAAEAQYTRAIQIDPTSVAARRGLARTSEALGKLDKAEAAYHEVIELRPTDIQGYYDLELFYLNQGRFEDANDLMTNVLATEPEGFQDWNTVGAMYFKRGEYDKAAEMFDRSLEIAPNYGAYSNLGYVQFMKGDFAKAAEMCADALKIDDRDYRVWINLASFYGRLPEYADQIVPTYRRAIQMAEIERQRNPLDPIVMIHLAECYVVVDDTTTALQLADSALAQTPDNIEVIVRAGLVYEQLGERDPALTCIANAIGSGFPRDQLEAMPELKHLLADSRLNHDAGATKPVPEQK